MEKCQHCNKDFDSRGIRSHVRKCGGWTPITLKMPWWQYIIILLFISSIFTEIMWTAKVGSAAVIGAAAFTAKSVFGVGETLRDLANKLIKAADNGVDKTYTDAGGHFDTASAFVKSYFSDASCLLRPNSPSYFAGECVAKASYDSLVIARNLWFELYDTEGLEENNYDLFHRIKVAAGAMSKEELLAAVKAEWDDQQKKKKDKEKEPEVGQGGVQITKQ